MRSVASKQTASGCGQALKPCPAVRHGAVRRTAVVVQANSNIDTVSLSRRQLLGAASLASASFVVPEALAAKGIKGFTPVEDLNDGYKFAYPFGWQEVAVNGADVVFKDIVEPLESVSVSMTTTDKKDITEFGPVQEVCETLAKDVLTAPGTEVKLLGATQRDQDGHSYYEFEFTAKGPKYTRHQLAVVAVAKDKFYTLTTGSNERRWGRMKDKLQSVVKSFQLTI